MVSFSLSILNSESSVWQHQGRIQNFSRGGLSNIIVYAHCKVKSVRGEVLKQNFMDNNTRSLSLSLAVTPALSG